MFNTSTLPPPKSTVITKGDSAASNHYWALRDSMILDDVSDEPFGTSVTLPDKSTISSIKKRKSTIYSVVTQSTRNKNFQRSEP